VPSLRLRQKAINLAQTDDGLFKVNDVLKFTVYVLTVYKHSWVQRRAGPRVPASARSPKGSSVQLSGGDGHANLRSVEAGKR